MDLTGFLIRNRGEIVDEERIRGVPFTYPVGISRTWPLIGSRGIDKTG